jgi:hypothetical protein
MRWRKLGRVFAPSGDVVWAASYAHLPTPVAINVGSIRVYFAGLDGNRFGRVGYVDVLESEPTHVIGHSIEPALDIGEAGTFDDCGVNPASILHIGSRFRMYYIGWQRVERVPYQLFSGAAESDCGSRFQRLSRSPILDRSDAEPYLRSAPFVLRDGHRFRAWYVSAIGWNDVNGRTYPRYIVRTVDSTDGLTWPGTGPVCIDLEGDEFGIGRPWVVRDADRFRMWYSIRSQTRPYRIGYAESADGIQWTRRDNAVGISASESGWDSQMICYAAVLDVGKHRYMFYNGNGHGASGFGCAVLEPNT